MTDDELVPEAGLPAPPGPDPEDPAAPPSPAADAVPEAESGPDLDLDPDLAALVEEQQARLMAQDEEVRRLREEVAALRQEGALTVTKYREVLLALHAEVPEELVQGGTLEAVETSFATARQAVATIRQHLQSQADAVRVPAGAPVRGGPDLDGLTPQQKIALGLQRGMRNE